MAKLCLKKTSKRMGCAKRFKIEKKVRDHNKKQRREAKKLGKRKHREKTISVPNSCPFKEEILLEAERCREQIEAQRMSKKKQIKQKKTKKTKKVGLIGLVEEANNRMEEFDERQLEESPVNGGTVMVQGTRSFAGEVLDARDPLGSRDRTIERTVIEGGKRLVLLLNKIDLVPRENVERWLQYLRRQLPTVAFKASTQEQATKLGRSTANVRTSKCVGAEQLMTVLGNYCRNRDIKTAIRVGVIGYPNVGKSSVINSLKRKRSCNVGATPGVTRQIQEVELDKHIRLLDSPGVVLTSKSDMDAVEAALRNAIRIEAIEDPIIPVQAILRRCPAQSVQLMLHYSLPEFHSCEEFLALLARRLGRLKKGARPDLNAAARKVLNDWNGGQLRYHTQPPDVENENEAALCSAELLAQYSDEFQLDSVDDSTILQEVPMDSSINVAIACDMMNVAVTMEKSGPMTVMDERPLKKRPVTEKSSEHELPQSLAMGENLRLNTAIKKAVKERRRRDKKQGKRAERLADAVQATSLSDRMDIG